MSGPRLGKREELSNRILTDREVSDLRAIRAVKSSREVLARVEQIVVDHCAAVWSEAYRHGVEDMTGTETLDVVRRNPFREPKWVDMFGIDPDYTDGKPIDEWLEEQRGEA